MYLFHLHKPSAHEWVEEFVSKERRLFGDSQVVEHRYAGELASAIAAEGLVMEVLR